MSSVKTKPVNVKNHYIERGFDELPFYYLDGENPYIYWMCNYDQDKKITSVLENTRNKEKFVRYFDTIEEAKSARNELIMRGWIEAQLPEVNVDQEDWDALPRQQKRRIQRGLMKQAIREHREDKRKQERRLR